MELLLDTHAALWWAENPALLTPEAAATIANPLHVVWFSVASAWELAIKVRSGKLEVDIAGLVAQLTQNGIRLLGIGVNDAITAGSLDWSHRDPFDRMLVSQATRRNLHVVTRDLVIQRFISRLVIEA